MGSGTFRLENGTVYLRLSLACLHPCFRRSVRLSLYVIQDRGVEESGKTANPKRKGYRLPIALSNVRMRFITLPDSDMRVQAQ